LLCETPVSLGVKVGLLAEIALAEKLTRFPVKPYSYLGCYTEGDGVRALGAFASVNQTTMTIEECAGLCIPTYTLFGLEYGGECWCANVFGAGSVAAPETDCYFPCAGNASETCGE
jgi:hypothetical protein